MLVALGALVVSVCAVAVSIYEASLERQHARAAAWPHVELTTNVSPAGVKITALNSGIGPATLDSVDVRVDGRPAAAWEDVFARVLVKQPESYSLTSITGRVLRPGDELVVVQVPADVVPTDVMARLASVGVTICYSSVFQEHWRLTIPQLVGASQVDQVGACGRVESRPAF
jgi:hypothetical protein